jgi:short-subunit dehydrogenase
MGKKRILITGASRGIGLAMGELLAKHGFTVIGTSRRPEPLEHKIPEIDYIKLDLADEEAIDQLPSQIGRIDILINNAGGSQLGAAEDTPVEKLREIFQTNFFGTVRVIKSFLPQMRERRDGLIINVSSLAGKLPVPFQTGYVSSKYALNGFSWSLRNEVMKKGVKVVVIEPHDIHTSIIPELFQSDESDYREEVLKMKNIRDRNMEHAASPDIVARKVLEIVNMKNPGPFYAVGKGGPALKLYKRLLPDKVVEALVRRHFDQ